jgi:hypothetical protein
MMVDTKNAAKTAKKRTRASFIPAKPEQIQIMRKARLLDDIDNFLLSNLPSLH